MTGAAYRWMASVTLFTGGVTTLLSGAMILSYDLLLSSPTLLVCKYSSMVGICVSIASQFFYADQPDRESLLNHQAATLIGLGLNTWPLVFAVAWFLWMLKL